MKCLEARGNFENFEHGEEEEDIQHGTYEEEDGEGDGANNETMSDIAKGSHAREGWNGAVGTKGEVKGTKGEKAQNLSSSPMNSISNRRLLTSPLAFSLA